ncbi:MAG TPA: hypothetical protein VJH67_03310 [Candidatus Paceibacterota bacterium]
MNSKILKAYRVLLQKSSAGKTPEEVAEETLQHYDGKRLGELLADQFLTELAANERLPFQLRARACDLITEVSVAFPPQKGNPTPEQVRQYSLAGGLATP